MTYKELQANLKNLRNEGKIPASFKLNQKKEVLQAMWDEMNADCKTEIDWNSYLKGAYIDFPRRKDSVKSSCEKILSVSVQKGYDGKIRKFAKVRCGGCTYERWIDDSMSFVDKNGDTVAHPSL